MGCSLHRPHGRTPSKRGWQAIGRPETSIAAAQTPLCCPCERIELIKDKTRKVGEELCRARALQILITLVRGDGALQLGHHDDHKGYARAADGFRLSGDRKSVVEGRTVERCGEPA